MNSLSPSMLFREAAGLHPVGIIAALTDSVCVQCGGAIRVGEPATPLVKSWLCSDRFNNKTDVRAPWSTIVCGDCTVLQGRDYLQKYSKSFACRTGVYSLASNADQAWFLLNPPEPPFLAILSDTRQQHLIWRAPINWSRELISVRMGDRVLTIRSCILEDARRAVSRCHAIMEMAKLKGKHPFVSLDRELRSPYGTAIRQDVRRLAANDPAMSADIDLLESLALGELWALNSLIFIDASSLHPPRRLLPASRAIDAA